MEVVEQNIEHGRSICSILYDKYDRLEIYSRAFYGENEKLWPDGKVPYLIDPLFSLEEVNSIREAMLYIQNFSCIRMHKRVGERNYINITDISNGCHANLGYNEYRGSHLVNLHRDEVGTNCLSKETVTHELLHVVGREHEHYRFDRDSYVTVNWSNINPFDSYNFWKSQSINDKQYGPLCSFSTSLITYDNCFSGSKLNSHGIDYDPQSIMHYWADSGSNNGYPTITHKDGQVNDIGRKGYLTSLDIQHLQKTYKSCTDLKPSAYCQDSDDNCKFLKSQCSNMAFARLCLRTCKICTYVCADKVSVCLKNDDFCAEPLFKSLCQKTCNDCKKECEDESENCHLYKDLFCHLSFAQGLCQKSCFMCTI